ncbi:MAG: hypothetical protein ABR564_00315 [Candidatus Dormibacteria bacterium]
MEIGNRRTPLGPSRLGLALTVIALAAVAVAAVVAVRGLMGNPVGPTDSRGVTTLRGTFFPYDCGHGSCGGYVQQGGRGVYVVFPTTCPEPRRESDITVQARRSPQLGKESYTAVSCASSG